ncbi:MAG: exodeoxyribonuclease III [Pseudomonadota bacterium]|nr:exodeoxyribonuclease III [Pseudomonadota bacterium]
MKIATWNVNSLKVRLPHLLGWLEAYSPDVMCLQETKLPDERFPVMVMKEAGYEAVWSGQNTYNGVAILSRNALSNVSMGIPGFADEQKRVLAATVGTIRIVCIYVPNGQDPGSDKFSYKLAWLEALTAYVRAELALYPKLVLLGDFNIAPEDRDVHDPAALTGQILVSPPERDAFKKLIQLGFNDSFRIFTQEPGQYSWWDYRMNAFRRNMGLRIDHILVSREVKSMASGCMIDRKARAQQQPSDHAPVMLYLASD